MYDFTYQFGSLSANLAGGYIFFSLVSIMLFQCKKKEISRIEVSSLYVSEYKKDKLIKKTKYFEKIDAKNFKEKRKEIETFYILENNIAKEIFYDIRGNKSKQILYTTGAKKSQEILYTNDGKKAVENIYTIVRENKEPYQLKQSNYYTDESIAYYTSYTSYKYNQEKTLIKIIIHAPDGKIIGSFAPELTLQEKSIYLQNYFLYLYDSTANIIQKVKYNPDGSIGEYIIYKYDNAGNMILEDSRVRSGNYNQAVKSYEYDASGNKIKGIEYYYPGEAKYSYQYKYDKKGNMIQKISVAGDRYDEIYRYKYNKKGNIINKASYKLHHNRLHH